VEAKIMTACHLFDDNQNCIDYPSDYAHLILVEITLMMVMMTIIVMMNDVADADDANADARHSHVDDDSNL
jgi:hypothetical protein